MPYGLGDAMITSHSVSSIDNINEDSAVPRDKIRVYWPPRVEYYPILFNSLEFEVPLICLPRLW